MNPGYTAAVIGLGRIGASYPSEGVPRTHTAAYLNHPKVNLVAAIDPDIQARKIFRLQWGKEWTEVGSKVHGNPVPPIYNSPGAPIGHGFKLLSKI